MYNHRIQTKLVLIILFFYMGIFTQDVVYAIEQEKLNFIEEPSQIFQQTVSQELQCTRLDWYTIDGELRFECQHANEQINIHAYGSIHQDVNGDGYPDLILAMEFPQREQTSWKGDDHDLLLVYILWNDGKSERMFRHELMPGDDGGMMHLALANLAGDLLPEIVCVEMELYVGAKRDHVTTELIVVRGRPPFFLVGEMNIRKEMNLEGTLMRQADIQFQDRDDDGIQELILTWSEGIDRFSLTPFPSASEVYHMTFTLTAAMLDVFRQAGLPEAITQALHPLLDRTFVSKPAFLEACTPLIGAETVTQYGDVIVQTAIGPYQLQQP